MGMEMGDELRRFLEEEGVAAVVGTRDAELVPEVCRAWGFHVLPGEPTLEDESRQYSRVRQSWRQISRRTFSRPRHDLVPSLA